MRHNDDTSGPSLPGLDQQLYDMLFAKLTDALVQYRKNPRSGMKMDTKAVESAEIALAGYCNGIGATQMVPVIFAEADRVACEKLGMESEKAETVAPVTNDAPPASAALASAQQESKERIAFAQHTVHIEQLVEVELIHNKQLEALEKIYRECSSQQSEAAQRTVKEIESSTSIDIMSRLHAAGEPQEVVKEVANMVLMLTRQSARHNAPEPHVQANHAIAYQHFGATS